MDTFGAEYRDHQEYIGLRDLAIRCYVRDNRDFDLHRLNWRYIMEIPFNEKDVLDKGMLLAAFYYKSIPQDVREIAKNKWKKRGYVAERGDWFLGRDVEPYSPNWEWILKDICTYP